MSRDRIRISTGRLTAGIAILLLAGGCASTNHRQEFVPSALHASGAEGKYLKAHLINGNVAVLKTWQVDADRKFLTGVGEMRDVNRQLISTGVDTLPLASVALFEMNDGQPAGGTAALTVVTVASAAMSVYCITNPKACFGSCPTFYAWDGESMTLQAEGFSSSILPALEERDVDPLWTARPRGREVEIRMTNEAMETHIVRYVHLLTIPRPVNGRIVMAPDDRFYEATHLIEPSDCRGPEGDCLRQLQAFDALERFSLADSVDLASREEIEIHFTSVPPGPVGVVIGFRQSLLPTYLFYQGLAYLGRNAGSWLAAWEGHPHEMQTALDELRSRLGAIEVLIRGQNGGWTKAGEVAETGPIAKNVQVVPLPVTSPSPAVVRLRMAKGLWRINNVWLASLKPAMEAIRLYPLDVRRENSGSSASALTVDSLHPLVTYPGDVYNFRFELPPGLDHPELFLESRGYYLEWLREEWLAEQDDLRAGLMILEPKEFLRTEAPRFKIAEPEMEDAFWRSRYVR